MKFYEIEGYPEIRAFYHDGYKHVVVSKPHFGIRPMDQSKIFELVNKRKISEVKMPLSFEAKVQYLLEHNPVTGHILTKEELDFLE